MIVTAESIAAFIRSWLTAKSGPSFVVADDESLLAAGIDSLSFLDLLTAVEGQFGVEIEFDGANPDEFTTIRGLVTLVHKALVQMS